jgi:hypothetical protein
MPPADPDISEAALDSSRNRFFEASSWIQLHDVARVVSDDDKVRSATDDFIENVEVKKVIKDKFHI